MYLLILAYLRTETTGMTDYSINRCSSLIQIQMTGIIESFNLAVSSGIVFVRLLNSDEIMKNNKDFYFIYLIEKIKFSYNLLK